jgi:glycosyltransferase involved in cell wall biosynthesis
MYGTTRLSDALQRGVFLNWQLGNTFGWGILGLNVFLHWANDSELRPLMGHRITDEGVAMCDPLKLSRAHKAMLHSNQFLTGLEADADGRTNIEAVLVDSLGNGLPPSNCYGTQNIARCVFENTDVSGARAALSRYDALLAASNWNAQLLEQATGRQAKVIFEGVDTSLFCPAPKSGLMDHDKFYVFSGGKVEFRKGHDLVLLAFKRFHERHSDAVLVTAWHSPWPRLSEGFRGRLTSALEIGADGALDIGKWMSRNGIDPQSVIDVGLVPNPLMPSVLREMDVALQPSRAEACTSLPVKEAMACGVPVIAAFNTGMIDLLTDDNCIALRTQAPITDHHGASTDGWGESDVDEIVAALEFAYERREQAKQIGMRSREWLMAHGRTWQSHAAELKAWILPMD